MSKQCEICGKKPMSGNNVSHAHNKSRTIWNPNLQKIRAQHQGSVKTIKACTRCIRTGKIQKVV